MHLRQTQFIAAVGVGILAGQAGWTLGQETRPAATQPAGPSSPATPAPKRWPFNLATSDTLTGDWGGVRTALKDVGFSFAPNFYPGYIQNYKGGANTTNAADVPGVMQYNVEFDFDKKKLIPGGSFYMRVVESWNDRSRRDVGSLSIPAYGWGSTGDHPILVDKWWWRQRFLNDRIEIRVGKLLSVIDLFDANAYAGNNFGQFSNSWLTANPTVPSTKGLGAFIKVWPTNWLYFQTGAMDPDQVQTKTGFDTAFHGEDHFRGYWEFGFTPKWDTVLGKLPGNYRFGWWYDPQPKLVFEHKAYKGEPDERETGDVGFYTNFDQLVWKESTNPKDKQGLGVFGRYGYAPSHRNKLAHFWSVGAQYEGLLPGRDRDVLAFGVGQGIASQRYRDCVKDTADRETVYELYYLIQVTPWLCITPDIQVITNPGADRLARDSLVGGVRLKIAF